MELDTIEYRVENGVAHVTLARPEGANAVSSPFAADFRRVVAEVEWDPEVRSVAVTAQGKVFCAGGDLKEFNAAGDGLPKLGFDLLTDFHAAIYRMNRMPKPWVAGVRGAAGGAGLSLMSAFDLAVAGESTKFTMAYTRAGMTPDGTSTYFISRHIGVRRMLDLTLTNRVLSAAEAEAWGLVNRVVPDEEVDDAAVELAATLATGAPYATGHAKRVVYQGADQSLETAGEFEAEVIMGAMATADGQEGIAAFVEKRSPEFKGE